jgi:hypothetical protein
VGIVSVKNTVPVLKQKYGTGIQTKIPYRYSNKNTAPVFKTKKTVPGSKSVSESKQYKVVRYLGFYTNYNMFLDPCIRCGPRNKIESTSP